MEGRKVDLEKADWATLTLTQRFDTVLVEGAGGLMVPIEWFYTMLDYAADRGFPVILVTNPRLGSVNHALLSLEACRARGVEVDMLAYSLWGETSPEITADTRRLLKEYLRLNLPECEFMEVPVIDLT